jgi:hypothetical protein
MGQLIHLGGKQMRFLTGLYIVIALMVFVNLSNEYIFDGEYSGIAIWVMMGLFILGTAFFINGRYYLSKNTK